MAYKKKDLPLEILKIVEPFSKRSSKLYKAIDPGDSLVKIIDTDTSSNFRFEITGYTNENKKDFLLQIEFSPRSKNTTEFYKGKVNSNSLESHFVNWSKLLDEYDKIEVFDDPILRQYEREFESELKVVDEDADYNSFDYQTQLKLDAYLTNCQTILETSKNEDNEKEVELIQEEIKHLKDNQVKITKNAVVAKLAKILAKIRKLGLSLIKEVYETAKKELIKKLISGQIEDLIK